MGGQTSFDVPPEPTEGQCAWCEEPNTTKLKIELEPAVRGIDKMTGVKVIKKHAIKAWVCRDHYMSLERSDRVKRAAAKAQKKAGKGVVVR